MFKQRLRKFFLQKMPESELEAWFDPLVFLQADNSLRIQFPHRLFFEWFEARYRPGFEQGLRHFSMAAPVYCDATGHPLQLSVPRADKTGRRPDWQKAAGLQGLSGLTGLLKKTEAWDGASTFGNFLFNRKNECPVSAAKEFTKLEGAGQLTFYAAPGCGKSHLLAAMFQEMKIFVPENNIFFGRLEELETIIENNAANDNPFFLPFCVLKALLIDNFQECAGKPAVQENLIKLLELCSKQNIYLALALDATPPSCSYLSPRLRSLLNSGLILEIKKPDLDVKTRYIRTQNEKIGLKLKKEEILYLARLYSDFRQIRGALLKILSFKSLRPVAADFVLSNILETSGPNGAGLTPQAVLDCVAAHLRLPAERIRGWERSRQMVFARQLTMYLLRELLPINLNLIGEFMGRDHSSVLYSLNKIKEMMTVNEDINKLVANLKNMCLTQSRSSGTVA